MLGKIEGRRRGLYGHGFEQAPGVGDGQGSLACCSPWGCKELDMSEQLNWTGEFPFWGYKVIALASTHLGGRDFTDCSLVGGPELPTFGCILVSF